MALDAISNKMVIGFRNWFDINAAQVQRGGAVHDGGSHLNAWDDNTFDFWLPDGSAGIGTNGSFFIRVQSPNALESDRPCYLGYSSHNLGSENYRLQIQTADGSPSVWTNTHQLITPAHDDTGGALFTPTNIADDGTWRVSLSGPTATADARIGVLHLGECLEIETPVFSGTPILHWSFDDDVRPNLSASGEYLGRSVYQRGRMGEFTLANLSSDFIRSTRMQQFISHSRRKPFFIWPRPKDNPGEVYFAWLTKPLRIQNTGPADLCSVRMSLKAWAQ